MLFRRQEMSEILHMTQRPHKCVSVCPGLTSLCLFLTEIRILLNNNQLYSHLYFDWDQMDRRENVLILFSDYL